MTYIRILLFDSEREREGGYYFHFRSRSCETAFTTKAIIDYPYNFLSRAIDVILAVRSSKSLRFMCTRFCIGTYISKHGGRGVHLTRSRANQASMLPLLGVQSYVCDSRVGFTDAELT